MELTSGISIITERKIVRGGPDSLNCTRDPTTSKVGYDCMASRLDRTFSRIIFIFVATASCNMFFFVEVDNVIVVVEVVVGNIVVVVVELEL